MNEQRQWPAPDASRSEIDAFKQAKRQAAREAWATAPRPQCPLCEASLRQTRAPGDGDTPMLVCSDGCEFTVVITKTDPCTECGHHHAGKHLAGICIGCICQYPGGKDVVIHAIVRSTIGDIPTTWVLGEDGASA